MRLRDAIDAVNSGRLLLRAVAADGRDYPAKLVEGHVVCALCGPISTNVLVVIVTRDPADQPTAQRLLERLLLLGYADVKVMLADDGPTGRRRRRVNQE